MLSFRSFVFDHTNETLKVLRLGSYACYPSGPTFWITQVLFFRSIDGIFKVQLFGSYTCYPFRHTVRMIEMRSSYFLDHTDDILKVLLF